MSIELVDDPAGGWSLHAVPSNFRLAPENASGDHVDGEGHMYLYINGEEVARVYETWSQMPPLPAGTHDITVSLRTNDPVLVTRGGVAIAAHITLEVSEDEATMPAAGEGEHGGGHAMAVRRPGTTPTLPTPSRRSGGRGRRRPEGGVRRVEADVGSVVALMVTSDLAEEVHVHGYDILRAVSEGKPAHFAFTAEIPGVFEVEFEGSGRLLLQLEIS